MKKFILILTAAVFYSIQAMGGTGSGAGGTPAVYQSLAIQTFLKDNAFLFKINSKNKFLIRTIEYLNAKDGVSSYRVTSMSGCDLLVETTADEWGTNYTVKYGSFDCRHVK